MNVKERLPQEKAAAYAMRVIKDNILDLELEPGSPVSENELASELKISRTPVREALIELSRMDLIDIVPQKGTIISPIDLKQVKEARVLRRVAELEIVRELCAKGVSPAVIERLEESLERQRALRQVGHEEELHAEDMHFHRLLYEAVDKLWTYGVIRSTMYHFDRLRILTLKTFLQKFNLRDHENLVYALSRQDEELACIVMEKHLTREQLDRDILLLDYPTYVKNLEY